MDDDRARFEEMFNRHYGALMRYAGRRLDPDQAADVVSETFLVAWRRLDDVPAASPLPWLYATARNVIGREIRGRDRRARLNARMGVDAAAVADHADRVTEQVRIRRALALLSEPDQEVLRLAAWERLSTAEAAAVLGCGRATYKVRLHRARRRLAALLGNDPLDNDDPQPDPAASALVPLAQQGGS